MAYGDMSIVLSSCTPAKSSDQSQPDADRYVYLSCLFISLSLYVFIYF